MWGRGGGEEGEWLGGKVGMGKVVKGVVRGRGGGKGVEKMVKGGREGRGVWGG